MKFNKLFKLLALGSLVISLPATAVQLSNFTINGQPVAENTPVTLSGGQYDQATGLITLTLAGKLTYEPSVDVVGKDGGGDSVDTSKFSTFGGVPGVFASSAVGCQFKALPGSISATDASAWTSGITPIDTLNCFPMFSLGKLQQVTWELFPRQTYYDASYGTSLNMVPAVDGTFTRTITITAAKASQGFTLTYQLPIYRYPFKDQILKIAKTFTISKVVTLTASSQSSGALANRSISGTLTAEVADLGKTGNVYVGAVVPGAGLFFRNGSGGWVLYDGKTDTPSQSGVTLGNSMSVPVLPAAADLTTLAGTDLYLAAGVSLDDVVKNGKFVKVETVR